MTSKKARSTGRSVTASKRSKRARTQAEETNDKPESPSYLDVLADQARVVAENEAASSQMQQDDALEAKEASQVDGDDSSQEQTESGHNDDGEDYEDGQDDEDDNEDGEDDDNNNEYAEDDGNDDDNDNGDGEDKNSDDDENTTIADDKTEEESDENVRSSPAEASTSGRDPSRTSTDIVVKTIRFENYNLKMLMDVQGDLEGDIVVRSSMGRGFTEFRKILRENDLVKFFKSSCFGKYLDLPNDTTARFQMTMVYSLLRRRILCEKKDEVWINYCGMPVCFGMKEFAVMTGLNCHSPPRVGGANSTTKGEDLFKLVGKSYKEKNLLEHLKSKTVSRNVKKSLCLVWFVHSVLCARDVGKNISSDWIKLSADYEAFNAYPWGRESFKLTVEYLLRELKPNVKTINLYGFPWAFMAWAFEVIPHLQHQVKDFPEEVSSPRILRWLAAKNNKAVGVDLFYPLRDSVVHPWIIPTKEELKLEFLSKFEPLESCPDPKIGKLKGDLAGVTAIRRDWSGAEKDDAASKAIVEAVASYVAGDATRIDDDHHSFGGGYTPFSTGGARGGDGGKYTPVADDVRHEENTPYVLGKSSTGGAFKVPSCACECLKCKENMNMLLSKIDALTEAQGVTEAAINKLISKRGIYPSSRISEPFTPVGVKRRRKQISKALASAKKKAANTPKMTTDQPTERLPVNVYKYADDKKKKKIQQMIKTKRSTKQLYTMHEFNYQDFECMTDMDRWWEDWYVDEILCLMRIRHIDYPNHYNPTDIILDLNFYNFMKDVYAKLSEECLQPGAIQLKQRLDNHDFTDYFLDYCKGVRPYPGGVPWLGAKRFYTVMTIERKHFVALEIMIDDGVINVYDCNIPCCPEEEFFLHIQPMMELWPRFLKQSGMFDHLPPKLLNEEWTYDRKKGLPKNETGAACGSYSLAFIEHLITNSSMNLLCDNAVGRMRWRWVVGVVDKELVP